NGLEIKSRFSNMQTQSASRKRTIMFDVDNLFFNDRSASQNGPRLVKSLQPKSWIDDLKLAGRKWIAETKFILKLFCVTCINSCVPSEVCVDRVFRGTKPGDKETGNNDVLCCELKKPLLVN